MIYVGEFGLNVRILALTFITVSTELLRIAGLKVIELLMIGLRRVRMDLVICTLNLAATPNDCRDLLIMRILTLVCLISTVLLAIWILSAVRVLPRTLR